jgi:hypothetical protein
MKYFLIIPLTIVLLVVNAQDQMLISGQHFLALSVSNADATSKWYEDVFQLRLLKEIKTPDGSVHIRIIGNDHLLVEIIQQKDSKTIADAGVDPRQPYELQGIFKAGIYVRDIFQAEKYLKQKEVLVKHGVFDDAETQTKSLIITDADENLIQVIQREK